MSYYNYSPERIYRKDFFGNSAETTSSMVPNIIAGSTIPNIIGSVSNSVKETKPEEKPSGWNPGVRDKALIVVGTIGIPFAIAIGEKSNEEGYKDGTGFWVVIGLLFIILGVLGGYGYF